MPCHEKQKLERQIIQDGHNRLTTKTQTNNSVPGIRLTRSRLEPFRSDIEQLHRKGWKPPQIVEWLEEEKDIETSPSAVYRMLRATRDHKGSGGEDIESLLPSPVPSPTPVNIATENVQAASKESLLGLYDEESKTSRRKQSDMAFSELRELMHDMKAVAERQIDASNRLWSRLEAVGDILTQHASRSLMRGCIVAGMGIVIASGGIAFAGFQIIQRKSEQLSQSFNDVAAVAMALEEKDIQLSLYNRSEAQKEGGMTAIVFKGDIKDSFVDQGGRAVVVLDNPGR